MFSDPSGSSIPTNSSSRAGSIPAFSAAATIPCSYSASHNSHMGFGVVECQQKKTGPSPIGSMNASSLILVISRTSGERCSVFRLRIGDTVAKGDSLCEAGSNFRTKRLRSPRRDGLRCPPFDVWDTYRRRCALRTPVPASLPDGPGTFSLPTRDFSVWCTSALGPILYLDESGRTQAQRSYRRWHHDTV